MANDTVTRKPYATIIAVLVVGVYYFFNGQQPEPVDVAPIPASSMGRTAALQYVDGQMLDGTGVVEKLLSDDNEGSRHQRFIVKLSDGRTLLIAHNIDLAPRIDRLKRGDQVQFRGQYETNERGGVVHWTHADPRGDHPAGWLEHEGRRYQ
ncbi:MAG: hypothetical protein ACI9BW_001767 [Gammaproteobacteria bacterium]|jgi:hypothetical protein